MLPDACRTILSALAIMIATSGVPLQAEMLRPYDIKITAIVEHPALDAVRQGIYDELIDRGLRENSEFTWEYQSAQGNTAIAAQIAKKFAGDRPSVIIAIATPSAQSVAAAVRGNSPVVFSTVTDPVGARLVSNMEKPGANITGTCDILPLKEQLALIREMLPGVRSIGLLFNPSEANSVAVAKQLSAIGKEEGITIIEGAAPDTNSVQSTARALVGKVDAFFVPTDNTVVAAIESVARVSIENKIPLFASDTDSVSRGALAALGFNYYDMGHVTGKIVYRILTGEKPGDIPVGMAETFTLVLNAEIAEKIGLSVPHSVMERATIIRGTQR